MQMIQIQQPFWIKNPVLHSEIQPLVSDDPEWFLLLYIKLYNRGFML